MKRALLIALLACSQAFGTAYCVLKTGSDSAAGTSAGAAWVTIGKAVGATCGGGASACTAGGDTVYVGAGVYREAVTIANTYASVFQIIADKDGSHCGVPGRVIWSGNTTNDYAFSVSALLNLSGKSNITVQGFELVCANVAGGCVDGGGTSGSKSITLDSNHFIAIGNATNPIRYTSNADDAGAWIIQNCIFFGPQSAQPVLISLTRSGAADYDNNFVVKSNLFLSQTTTVIQVQAAGASTFFGGGVRFLNNTVPAAAANIFRIVSAQISSTYPCVGYGNVVQGSSSFNATTAGQIIEDYNVFPGAASARGSTPTGANSSAATLAAWYDALQFVLNGQTSSGKFSLTHLLSPWKNMGTITGDTRPPGTAADDAAVGTIAWGTPANANQSDTVSTTAAITAGATGHYLKVTNFGLAVPGGATIIGIMVDVQRNLSAGTGVIKDNIIKLVNSSGTIAGTDHANTALAWPASLTWASYGNVAGGDLWGLTLTPSDVNNSAFGVVISAKETGGAQTGTAAIDCVRMTVYYTPQITTDMLGTTRPYGTVLFGAEGTATSGGNNTITQSTANWPVNGFKGYGVFYTGGTASGVVKAIVSNTATALTVSGNHVTNPDSTTTFKILHGIHASSGKLTSGSTTIGTDSNAAWGTNEWTGHIFCVTAGTGSGQCTGVASNTATAATFQTTLTTGLDNTSVYEIRKGPGTSLLAINYTPGALEVPQTCFSDTGTVHTSGTASARIMGPGYCDFQIAVGARSTTVTVWALFDSLYAGTKPQLQVLNGTEAGVANATATSTASASSWQRLSLTFTPTARGIVTLRILSNSTSPTGSAFFGDFGRIDQDSTRFQFTRRGEFFLSPHSLSPVLRQ